MDGSLSFIYFHGFFSEFRCYTKKIDERFFFAIWAVLCVFAPSVIHSFTLTVSWRVNAVIWTLHFLIQYLETFNQKLEGVEFQGTLWHLWIQHFHVYLMVWRDNSFAVLFFLFPDLMSKVNTLTAGHHQTHSNQSSSEDRSYAHDDYYEQPHYRGRRPKSPAQGWNYFF